MAVLAAVTVARFHVWAPVDERAHYAYVQSLAEHGRLPKVNTLVSRQVQAITDDTWPKASPTDPARAGLAGRSYEAFQPPLYYLAAVPAFALVGDHRDKVFALRAFDVLLLALACALLLLLARRELPEAPLVAFAGALGVLLWPGMVVRTVTVSNLPLELVLATALLLSLERAHDRRDARWLLASGGLLGACLLTKLTLVYLALPFAGVVWVGRRRSPRAAALAAVAPLAVLAPWLVSNLVRLGHLTADAAARRQQIPYLYPGGDHLGAGDLPAGLWNLTRGVLPQEWADRLGTAWVHAATLLLLAALVLGALAALGHAGGSVPARLAGAAVAGFIVVAALTLTVSHWDVFLLRYAYPVLPVLAATALAGLWRRAGSRAALATMVVWSVLLAALWVDMAGRFYFTGVGRRLGL